MGEIPLLTRKEEIRLARKIEIPGLRFGAKLLCLRLCDFASAVKCYTGCTGRMPFDRTVQVSVTDRLEKDQFLAVAVITGDAWIGCWERNAEDYRGLGVP